MSERTDEARILRELFVHSFLGPSLPVIEAGAFASRIGAAMRDVHLRAREVIYREGDVADHLYFIVSGEVQLETAGAVERTLGERAILAIDALLARPRLRTAVAVGPAHLLTISAEIWLSTLEESFDAARSGILRFAGDLQDLELSLRLADGAGQLGSVPTVEAALPGALTLVDRILALRQLALFGRAHMQAITMLAELVDELRPSEGELLFARGESPRALLVVLAGEVTITDALGRGARFGPGTSVGGAGAIAPLMALYEWRASAPTILLRLRHEDYWDVLEEHVDLVRSALVGLARERELLLSRAAELRRVDVRPLNELAGPARDGS